MNQYDVIVIGAGVAGLSAAAFLAKDANVLVLERESQPAYHSSGRSASVYIEGYENPIVAELTKSAGPFFRDPPVGFTDTPLLHARGGLTAARPGEERLLNKYLEQWQPLCPDLVYQDKEATIGRCRILNPEAVSCGGWDPTWMSIDTHALILGYQRMLRDHGGVLVADGEVTALSKQGSNWQVTTGAGDFSAPVVVNAAGSWAGVIGELVNLHKPLTPMRRTGVIVAAPDDVNDWPLVHTVTGDMYFKPESPGLMISPADETPSPPTDAQPEELDIAIAIDRFQSYTTHAVDRPMHTWAGLRTFAPDRFPLVGFDSDAPGFFWLAGQGGFGVQTSPEMGRLTAAIINQSEPVPETINATRF